MATFAPPVRRGDFLYSSILYADPGNGNHHPRASTAELAALLRPEAPSRYSKTNKPTPPTPSKDPVWHWYAAQLIHYGLPVTKDKNVAKVRLLNALNQFKLEVPAWVLKLESELKKEWEAENRKLKKGSSGAAKEKGVKSTGSGGREGRVPPSGQGVNVTVNVSLDSGMSMIKQLGLAQTGSASQKGKRKRGPSDEDASPKGKPTPKKAASATKSKAAPISSNSSTKASSVKKTANASATDPVPLGATVKPTYGRTLQTARKTATPRIKKEAPASSPYVSSSIKHEDSSSGYASARGRYVKQEPESGTVIILSGTYNIDTMNINAQALLDVYRDANRDIWWATSTVETDYERHHFVIKMDPGPSADTLGRAVTLGWRMRNMYTEEVKFGSGCTGEATFFDDNGVTMVLKGVPDLGDVELSGHRVGGPNQPGDLQEDWDHFRRDAYGR